MAINQFCRYAVVGGVATVVDWGLFYIVGVVLNFHYQVALLVSLLLGTVTNYCLNKIFTFKNKSTRIAEQFGTHVVVSGIAFLLSLALMYLFIDIFQMAKMSGRIITTAILLGVNYLMHKNLTFNDKFFKNRPVLEAAYSEMPDNTQRSHTL